MTDVIIVGDGPAGLSAALFLAKNGMETTVFGQDKTAMHSAMLYNYLGISEMTGTEFQKIAREQVEKFGAAIHERRVTGVEKTEAGFAVITEDGGRFESKYIIIAEGKGIHLALSLGLKKTHSGIESDRDGRTAIDKLYMVGRGTRIQRSQAIIAAGLGAAAALDILSREAGEDVHDYDSVD